MMAKQTFGTFSFIKTCSACTHLGLCCSAILIRATDVDAVVTPAATITGIHVRTQHTANDVAQVRHIVDIRQCTGDQNVSSSCNKSTPSPLMFRKAGSYKVLQLPYAWTKTQRDANRSCVYVARFLL